MPCLRMTLNMYDIKLVELFNLSVEIILSKKIQIKHFCISYYILRHHYLFLLCSNKIVLHVFFK